MSSRKKGDEAGLWDRVKKTVDPLDEKQRALYSQALADILADQASLLAKPKPKATSQRETGAGSSKDHTRATVRSGQITPGKPVHRPPQSSGMPPLVALDRRAKNRLARGRDRIDARLDLHGLRQHEAADVLRSFIWKSHAAGHRTVLVITGKGSRSKAPPPDAPPWAVGSGILRKAVPAWLAEPSMRAAILSVEPAHIGHGGEGALYVRLRAQKVAP